MTEPEQWAVELWTEARRRHEMAKRSLEFSNRELEGIAALTIQRAFEERERKLREEVAELRSVVTNDVGLLSCPKCHSLTGPFLYWWHRGQAWLAICEDCKHEAHAREDSEFAARNIWNDEARQALATHQDAPVTENSHEEQ